MTGQEDTVLVAACPPLREPYPLGPVVGGMRWFQQRVGEVELSPLGGALRPLFPEWAEFLPPALGPVDDPKETRHRLFRALTELVDRLEVTMVVVEDAHWADSATLEWLLTVATAEVATGQVAKSIVATYRPTDVPEGSLLLALTSRRPARMAHARIVLEPLSVEQTGQLVGSMLGTDEVSEEFASFLHERTDGVPLALEETIRLMRERHDIIRQRGSWTRKTLDEIEVPPTVRDSVLERVERLDSDARAVLRAAAILAEPADEMLLCTVADLGEDAGRRGVAGAIRAGLLRDAGGRQLVFRHVLDAQAVEGVAPASERWRLHRRAAEALQEIEPQPVVRLARHFREARDTDAWCHYAEAAADVAWQSGDDHVAVAALLELLTAAEHPVESKVRLARKLGDVGVFAAVGLGDLAAQVADALRDVVADDALPRPDRGEIRLQLGRMLWLAGQLGAAFAEHEQALPDLDHRPDLAVRTMINLATPMAADWSAEWHLAWLDRASELAPKLESPFERQAFAVNRACALLLLGEESGWQSIVEMAESASGQRERRWVATDALNLAEALLVWGRYAESRRLLDDVFEHIQSSDYQRLANPARAIGARLDWCTGAWPELAETAAALMSAEDTEPVERLVIQQNLGLLELVAGRRAAAEYQLRQVVDEYRRRGIVEPLITLAPAALGRLYLADGAAEAALDVTDAVVEMIARKGVWMWLTDVALVRVDALIAAGKLEQAEALVGQFAKGIAGRDAPAPVAAVATCRAMLAEATQKPAAALFAEAASAWATMPRPYDELLALERQGRCLLAAGDQEAGLKLLSGAQERLVELGARWDADRVARPLRQHGVEVARVWRRGRRGYGDQLSPRELEVVELVAQGMTNKQVAEVLFISPRTVTRHLSMSMRKLNVSSRTAVAMAAADAGLLSTDDG